MQNNASRAAGLAAGIVLAAGLTPAGAAPAPEPAAAPASDSSLTEIVVTAERREENLQKTPLALQVVSAQELADAGVVQVRDLVSVVPGLIIGQGGAATQIYIRGVGDFGSTPITNPAVAFNLDGVYVARTQAVEGNMFDVSRVEVLKGPRHPVRPQCQRRRHQRHHQCPLAHGLRRLRRNRGRQLRRGAGR